MKQSEHELISRITKLFGESGRGVVCGIGDDAAVLNYNETEYLLMTTDSMVENIHFKWNYFTPEELAIKAIRSNISDIHAMGGAPLWALISLQLPKTISDEQVDAFFNSVRLEAQQFSFSVVGGNLSRASEFSVSITMTGVVPKENLKKRLGCKVGEALYISAPVGYSALGLCQLQAKESATGEFVQAHKQTGIDMGKAKVLSGSRYVGAMMDVSDGLLQDLGHILKANKLGAHLDLSFINNDRTYLDACISLKEDPLSLALYGGEDYVLLFSVTDEKEFLKETAGLNFIRIGTLLKEGLGVVCDGKEVAITKQGFDHFL